MENNIERPVKRKRTKIVTTLAVSSIIAVTAMHKVISYASDIPLRWDSLFGGVSTKDTSSIHINPDTTYIIMPMDFEKITDDTVILNIKSAKQELPYLSQTSANRLALDSIIPNDDNILHTIKVINPKSLSLESITAGCDLNSKNNAIYAPIRKLTLKERDAMRFANHKKDSLYLMNILDTVNYYSEVVDKKFILSIIQNESHFALYPEVSSAKARGSMQLIEDGWNTVASESSSYLPDVYDSKMNVEAGIKLCLWLEKYCQNNYSELTRRHNYIGWNDVSLERKHDIIAAAYNAGIGRLSGLYGIPEKNRPKELRWLISHTPKQTRDYVANAKKTYAMLQEKESGEQEEKLLAYKK